VVLAFADARETCAFEQVTECACRMVNCGVGIGKKASRESRACVNVGEYVSLKSGFDNKSTPRDLNLRSYALVTAKASVNEGPVEKMKMLD
jgi:hypothetical protein